MRIKTVKNLFIFCIKNKKCNIVVWEKKILVHNSNVLAVLIKKGSKLRTDGVV